MAIVDLEQISKVQPMREGEIDTVDTVNAMLAAFPLTTNDIADAQITNAKLAANAVTTAKISDMQVTNAKLASNAVSTDRILDNAVTETKLADDIVEKLDIINSTPSFEYGVNNSLTVQANSNTVFTVSFQAAKTEIPVVFTSIQGSTTINLSAMVQSVSNAQASIIVFNNGTTDAENVTVEWLAISGR